MHYTIATADNSRVVYSLEKIGNEYAVSIWFKALHQGSTVKFVEYETAKGCFDTLCKHGKAVPHEIEHDEAEFFTD